MPQFNAITDTAEQHPAVIAIDAELADIERRICESLACAAIARAAYDAEPQMPGGAPGYVHKRAPCDLADMHQATATSLAESFPEVRARRLAAMRTASMAIHTAVADLVRPMLLDAEARLALVVAEVARLREDARLRARDPVFVYVESGEEVTEDAGLLDAALNG